MTTSRENSSGRTKKLGQVLVTVALSEIICGGQVQAFLMPVGFTSLQQQVHVKNLREGLVVACDDQINDRYKGCSRTRPIFAVKFYSGEDDYNYDQWEDNDDFANNEQQFDAAGYYNGAPERKYEGSKRAILGGAALGTMIAFNNVVDMSAGAEAISAAVQASSSEVPQQQQPLKSVSTSTYESMLNAQPAVTLPYLEKQIQAAENAISQGAAAAAAPKVTAVVAAAAPAPQTTTTTTTATVAVAAAAPAPQTTTTTATVAVAAAAPAPQTTKTTITVAAAPAPKTTAVTATVAAAPASKPTTVAKTSVTKIEEASPSFLRYTQEHIPGWIEAGQKVYNAAEPKIVSGGKQLVAEVDKRVTPKIIETERQMLGEENSAVLDKTLSSVASAGKMVAGMVGKVISFGIEGGVQIAKATPEVIAAGQKVYKTLDEKILPEVVDTSRKMKMIIDETVPEVMDAGKHAYGTIMPEVMNAEKQIASTLKGGVDMAIPKVMEINNKIVPELSQMERNVLGYERAAMLEKTVAEAAQQGQSVFQTVEKSIPVVFASGQKTVDSVAYTGRTFARAVPVIVESGKQTYENVDRSISNAILTTQDIASDLDRAAGKTAYAIEDNLFVVTGTLDKTLPSLLETGRQVAVTVPEIAKTFESGSKAIYEDVAGYVDDLKVQKTIDSAGKRFAATKTTFQDFTASVNDPNQMGKL